MTLKLRKNKRGTITDTPFVIILLFVAALIIPIGLMVVDGINDGFQGLDDGISDHSQSKAIMGGFDNQYASLFDSIFLMIFVGMLIVTIMFSLMVRTSPAFFFIGIIVMVMVLLVGGILANNYISFSESTGISSFAVQFPMMNFIFSNFIVVMLLFISLLSVILWAKSKS